MKNFFVLLFVSLMLVGCSTIPSDSSDFEEEKVKYIHPDAQDLSYDEASYLYFGRGKAYCMKLSKFDGDGFRKAFSDSAFFLYGMGNDYAKITPGKHSITFKSEPTIKGNVYEILQIFVNYNFQPGYVYIFDHIKRNEIQILFWESGTDEIQTRIINL